LRQAGWRANSEPSEFLGIGNTKNDYFKYSDKELNKMWTISTASSLGRCLQG